MKEESVLLGLISKEIESKYNCKVVSIKIVQILSLCVMVKIIFNDDFLYKPFEDIPKPDTIVFSERSITFTKRVDLFESIKKVSRLN